MKHIKAFFGFKKINESFPMEITSDIPKQTNMDKTIDFASAVRDKNKFECNLRVWKYSN